MGFNPFRSGPGSGPGDRRASAADVAMVVAALVVVALLVAWAAFG